MQVKRQQQAGLVPDVLQILWTQGFQSFQNQFQGNLLPLELRELFIVDETE